MQARTISYLRCAAYFRLLPRTRILQNRQDTQTHSRRRSYARSDDGNRPTALHWTFSFFFFPSTLWLHYVTRAMSVIDSLCCTHKIYMPLHNVNGKIGASFLNKRLSERPIFAEFCARGRRPASIGAGSELHSSRTCETWRAIPDSVNCHFSLWNRCASSRSIYLSPKAEIKLLRSEGSERLVFEERCSDFAVHTLSVAMNTNKNLGACRAEGYEAEMFVEFFPDKSDYFSHGKCGQNGANSKSFDASETNACDQCRRCQTDDIEGYFYF